MAENNPPLSALDGGAVKGLDATVAAAIAQALKRPLAIVPFESKHEMESTLAQEVNAMLSSGVCDLASGYPLFASDLGAPSRPTARVPDHPGAARRPLRPWVALQPLSPTAPYHAVALGLVVRDAAREQATLAEPGDARIGAVGGTMAGTIVSLYRNGRLRPQLVSLSQNEDALAELEAGRIDAALVALDRLDAWRLRNPGTALRRAAYLHPLRINIGFVARNDAADVLAAADRVIGAALADGTLSRWSAQNGVTWVAPGEPRVTAAIGIRELVGE